MSTWKRSHRQLSISNLSDKLPTDLIEHWRRKLATPTPTTSTTSLVQSWSNCMSFNAFPSELSTAPTAKMTLTVPAHNLANPSKLSLDDTGIGRTRHQTKEIEKILDESTKKGTAKEVAKETKR